MRAACLFATLLVLATAASAHAGSRWTKLDTTPGFSGYSAELQRLVDAEGRARINHFCVVAESFMPPRGIEDPTPPPAEIVARVYWRERRQLRTWDQGAGTTGISACAPVISSIYGGMSAPRRGLVGASTYLVTRSWVRNILDHCSPVGDDARSGQAMIMLDPEATDAGAMERVMLLETYTPAKTGGYMRDDSLKAMRLMRQVIENRLKAPARYGARGAESEVDIVKLGNQFANFGDYPELPPALKNNLQDTLRLANATNDPRQALYARFVEDAITAATEASSPLSAVDHTATGWRTAMHHSPGANFRVIATLQGNTFFSTSPVPPMRPRRRLEHR